MPFLSNRGGAFLFSFNVPTTYPHEPPKVKCLTKVFHPNLDLEGNICLNILREDWKPVLSINSILHGLGFLFIDPNADVSPRKLPPEPAVVLFLSRYPSPERNKSLFFVCPQVPLLFVTFPPIISFSLVAATTLTRAQDPLNKEAAQMMLNNPQGFRASVERAVKSGTYINNVYFPPCIDTKKK